MTRAIVVRERGGPEVLQLSERSLDSPGAGRVCVRTTAIGINYIDVYFRTGLYPQTPPFVPGVEACGIVEQVGPGVSSWQPGDRVAWAGVPESYAERVLAPADRLVRVPDGVVDEVAAAVMLQGMTAHYLALDTWRTQPGDVAVVTAAAGGVGLLLVQVLRAAQARIIALASTPEKRELAEEAGADHAIGYDEPSFERRVRELTHGRGADVVFDSVGASTFDRSLAALRPRGLLALYGQSSGPVPPFDPGRLSGAGSLFLTRPSLAHYTQDREELLARAGDVLARVQAGALQVRIGAHYPLDQAEAAHRALEGRTTTGKVLLLP